MEDSVAEAVAQEHHAQDQRNQQVLQVLKEKDLLIQQLQADQGYFQEQVRSNAVSISVRRLTSLQGILCKGLEPQSDVIWK